MDQSAELNPRLLTPQSCLSRELLEELNNQNMLTVKTRTKVCGLLNSLALESDEIEKRDSLRYKAIKEIMETEKSYMRQLRTLINFFVDPLQSILDFNTHNILFGHIKMIYNVNKELLNELEQDFNNVAHAFLKMGPFLKLYSVYAFDYKKAIITLQELSEKNDKFIDYLSRTEFRPEVQSKLNSLLIAPIQRVPRYKLLLQQVLLYTSPTEIEFKMLQQSVKEVENTANHINSLVEDQENTQIMINLQNSFVSKNPSIVNPCRKLLREGPLDKITRNGVKIRRYCVLLSDILLYCKILKDRPNKSLVENSLHCCCIFPLKKCKVVELFPGTFRVSCQGDGVIFQTSDEANCKLWVAAIKSAIDLHLEFRKTLRKESSRRRPLRNKKEMRNFEMENVISPNKRKFDYENVFRINNLESSDEDEEFKNGKMSCFKKLQQLKRKTNENGYDHFKSKRSRHGFLSEIENDHENKSCQSPHVNGIMISTPFNEQTIEKKKRSVRFSDIKPVPFKYDDDQDYLNSKFLEKSITKPSQSNSLMQRVSNFFSKWF